MDDFLRPEPPRPPSDPERTVHLDPFLARRLETRPWEVRAAQWRARELAELAFGEDVRAELTGRGGSPPFRGLLNLTVPFRSMEDHQRRERIFLSWVPMDPILSAVPFVFLFQPHPVGAL
jgi:hypothetical protein